MSPPITEKGHPPVCLELRRIEGIEETHESLREDIKEVRLGVQGLTTEMHNLGLDLRGFSELATNMLARFGDWDRMQTSIQEGIKETHRRLGTKLDDLDTRVRTTEVSKARIDVIEKVLWYLVAGIGALVIYYIQQRITV